MKKLVLLLFISSIFATKGQAKQGRTGNLIGYAQKSDFLKKKKGWFEHQYKNYKSS